MPTQAESHKRKARQPAKPQEGRLARPGGRTERVRQQMIAATLAIIAEQGVRAVTVEAVAVRAGIARTTLYRRWQSSERLILEVMRQELTPRASPVADTGSFRGDLKSLLLDLRNFLSSEPGVSIMEAVFFSRGSVDTAEAIHGFWKTRFQVLSEITKRAEARRELPPTADPRRIIEFAAAPVYFTMFVWREPVTSAYIDEIVDFVVAGCRATQGLSKKR